MRLSSWPALDDELAVAPVEGAGVLSLDGGFEAAEAGAAGAGAALFVPSGAGACVGGVIPDMARARVLRCLAGCCSGVRSRC